MCYRTNKTIKKKLIRNHFLLYIVKYVKKNVYCLNIYYTIFYIYRPRINKEYNLNCDSIFRVITPSSNKYVILNPHRKFIATRKLFQVVLIKLFASEKIIVKVFQKVPKVRNVTLFIPYIRMH